MRPPPRSMSLRRPRSTAARRRTAGHHHRLDRPPLDAGGLPPAQVALVRDGDRFTLQRTRRTQRGRPTRFRASAAATAGGAPSGARHRRSAVSSSAPASTGANRNDHGRLLETTSSGLIPGRRMKGAGQVHRQHREADAGGRGPGVRAGQFQHQQPDQGGDQMPADQRARLRRFRFGRADHQHDRGGKGNDGQRIVRGERKPLHDADRDRSPDARRSTPASSVAGRALRAIASRTLRRRSRRHPVPATKSKGAADCSAAPESSSRMSLLQVGHRGQVSRELDDAGRAAPVGAEADRRD